MSDSSDKVPDFAAALSARGIALAQAKRFEEAAEVYKKLLAMGPPDLQTLNNLGFILTSLERHEEALPYLRQSVAIEPNSIQTLTNLSIVLRALNRPRKRWPVRRRSFGSIHGKRIRSAILP